MTETIIELAQFEKESKLALLRNAFIVGEKSGFADYKLEDIISDLDNDDAAKVVTSDFHQK
jgi:hypothetical protein